MVGWHHLLNGHEFEQILGDSEGQGSLACYSPWGHKESDMTEQLNKEQQHSSHLLLGYQKVHSNFPISSFFFHFHVYFNNKMHIQSCIPTKFPFLTYKPLCPLPHVFSLNEG